MTEGHHIAEANVLRFPTSRKRSYPRPYVPADELPPNATRLSVGAFGPAKPLSGDGLRWLVVAQLMATPVLARATLIHRLDQWRSELPDGHNNREGISEAMRFLARLPDPPEPAAH